MLLSFEKTVEGLFFVFAMHGGESLDVDFTLSIVLNCNISTRLLVSGSRTKHVEHEFIVYFSKRDLNSDLIVETAANFAENFVDSTRNDTSIFVICC
jgi:hypothetical protein